MAESRLRTCRLRKVAWESSGAKESTINCVGKEEAGATKCSRTVQVDVEGRRSSGRLRDALVNPEY